MPGLAFGGSRFVAVYRLEGTRQEAQKRAEDICLEQTVEYPQDLISRADIRDLVFGKVLSLEEAGPGLHDAKVSFAVEVAGGELTQLINVLFGNISLKSGIRLIDIQLPGEGMEFLAGPRFGVEGIGAATGAGDRPVLCSAVKPMGLSARELSDLAFQFAAGGMDIVKDDHGISDQSFCPFEERVAACAEAVRRANEQTGGSCLYAPNITGPSDRIHERARFARDAGAGALLISPGLAGFDTMRRIRDDDEIALPILSHPAFIGSFAVRPSEGIGHGVIYGLLQRLAGADATIFPSFGGRFSFSMNECREIVDACSRGLGEKAPIYPVPAGGMTLRRVPELLRFYGRKVMLLIGGDLHRHGENLAEGCREFARIVREHQFDERGIR